MERQVENAFDHQVSLTDPDARSMTTSGKGTAIVGYKVQTAVPMMPQRQKISIRSAWRQTLRGLKSWLYRFERAFNGA
jgi:hypothetical protein